MFRSPKENAKSLKGFSQKPIGFRPIAYKVLADAPWCVGRYTMLQTAMHHGVLGGSPRWSGQKDLTLRRLSLVGNCFPTCGKKLKTMVLLREEHGLSA